jgi:hypothetical protein
MNEPFQYPDAPHVRRHGPQGYADTASFRPWLRDEFIFRCVFCLQRESWGSVKAAFDLDHFLPVSKHPILALDYDNLLYVCSSCNSAKLDQETPDPIVSLLSQSVRVGSDGILEPLTSAASTIVWQLGLNLPRLVTYRAKWIQVIRLAKEHKPDLYRQLLAYPDDLPDLSSLRPPGGNTRPGGIVDSHFERRKRGELPDTY